MSYDMAFKGVLYYPNKRVAKKVLKQLGQYRELEGSVVTEDELILDGQSIRVECFVSAPASMWESSCGAIETLAQLASNGHVNAQYDAGEGEDSILRIRYLPGGEEEELEAPFPDGMEPTVLDAGGGEDEVGHGEIVLAAVKGDEKKVRAAVLRRAGPPAWRVTS